MQAYRFGDFTLDVGTRELRRCDEIVHLSPKAFQLLETLVEAAPRALSKAELQNRLWPDTFVVEANLQHLVCEIRAGLADDPREPRYLRTVYGFGYAFQGEPVPLCAPRPPDVSCRFSWSGGHATMAAGEHILGRDGSAAIVIDSASVSRRHARIQVSGDTVVLEDLASKNGTFVGGRRIDGAVVLNDNDRITFGRVPVAVRICRTPATTETAVGVVRD